MKPRFYTTPSPFGIVLFAIRAVRCLFAVMASLAAVGACAQNIQPVYSFPQSPAIPFDSLTEGPDGNFYGTTWSGGSNGVGAVIKVSPNGAWSTVYSFSAAVATGTYLTNPDGAQPWAALALGPDGNFYGTTDNGGNGGRGSIFKVSTNGAFTALVLFDGTNGLNPEADLTLGPDGNFYGTTGSGGSTGSGNGTVFRLTTNGVLTTLHTFTASHLDSVTGSYTNSDGAAPYAGLTLGANGDLYGSTTAGGSGASGTLFEMTTNGAWTTIYTFSAENYNNSSTGLPNTNSDGASPTGKLALGADGNFYGTTKAGGKSGSGTVFRVTPDGTLTTLYTFAAGHLLFGTGSHLYTNSDGAQPYGGLTQGPNGNFYGTTFGGGSTGMGTVFEVTTSGILTSLLTFTNGNGEYPRGALTLGTNGNFYGMTEGGGSSGNGTVFEMTPSGALTTLISFANYNGISPYASLTLGPNGNFYGTTYQGGSYGAGLNSIPNGYGTVFEITSNRTLTTLISFDNTNGANPEAGLTTGTNGNLYGTTYSGGSNGWGSVFEITTNGVFTTVANFAGTNGQNPAATLILATDGNFYGTTAHGGANGYGTVFQVTPNGVLTALYSFTGGNDGENPYAGLTLGANGNFYGTSTYGGKGGYGTVFEVTSTGGFTALYSFTNGSDGADPYAGLTLGLNGNFYGTTAGDGSSTYGTVFEMTPNGALTSLYTFTGGNDSGSPDAALTMGPDGNFYGTTYGSSDPNSGFGNPLGTAFEVTSNGVFTTLVGFTGTNGENSKASLTLAPDGNFYGTTSYGGADGIGEIYRLNLPPEIIQQPAGQSAPAGGPVTLSVALFGTAPYVFQWLSNGIPILGATNSTLTLSDIAADDSAGYSIVVSNAWGSVTSAVASLTVGGPQISSITMSANGNVTLNCQTLSDVASRLWATTNPVVQADWTPIFTNSVTSPGAWQFTDTNGMFQQRFYRLSTP